MDGARARDLRVPPLLISFHYLIRGGALAKMLYSFWDSGQVAVLIDSGAFSAHRLGTKIRLTTYIDACKEYLSHDETWGCIQLDVIGEKDMSRRNLDRMVAAGVKPMPVVTVDAPVSVAAEYAQINNRMCVAGGLGSCSTPASRANGSGDWIKDRYMAVKEAAGPGSELHGLGYVWSPEMFTVPLTSVDSSSHSAGERFGVLSKFVRGQGITSLGKLKKHREAGWHKMDADYRDHLDRCGVTRRDWYDHTLMSVGPGSFAACQCTAASAQQSVFGKKHDRLIFQACSNWLCWARMLLVMKYGRDDSSFDFMRVRKELYDLRVLPEDTRNESIVELMLEVNAGARQ
jgi:hypothetical protein